MWRWIALALTPFALGALPAAAASEPGAPLEGRIGRTSIHFDRRILEALHLTLLRARPTAAGQRAGALGFAIEPRSALRFHAPGGDFERFEDGSLQHRGGFVVGFPGGRIDLSGFELRAAQPPFLLDLLDAAGRRWFQLENAHFILVPELAELHLEHVDLLISPELAERLGRPELAGHFVGTLDAVLSVELPKLAFGSACVADLEGAVDVSLTGIGTLVQAARTEGALVAMAPSAKLRNVGTADVPWYAAIEPDQPAAKVGPHPFLVLHLYRIAQGVLRQIGRSHAKHAFFATNENPPDGDCGCPPGNILYAGCADTYSVSTNLNRLYLAPRDEVTASASSGAWEPTGSHFDGDPADGLRDHGGDADHDEFEHRLVAREPDLALPGARYFIEAWYVVPGDVDIFNGMGHRRVVPELRAGAWVFPFADAALTSGSTLDEWVDPLDPSPALSNRTLDTGEGQLQLAARASDGGAGVHRYEYALMNFDFDRQIRSFAVPLRADVSIGEVSFGDVDDDAANDWTWAIGADAITWQAPLGNALDWGTLYNFGFEADAPPGDVQVALGVLEPGAGETVAVPALAPTPAPEPSALSLAISGLATVAWLARRRRPTGAREHRTAASSPADVRGP